MATIDEQHKRFLLNILADVRYLDYKFKYDTLSFPTDEQVQKLKAGTIEHKLRVDILHYGENSDPNIKDDKQWLTYCGIVIIRDWNKRAILEAIFIALVQKLRHEASETFMYQDTIPFHEHRRPNVAIPQ